MISADCFVFPAPKFRSSRRAERRLLYIPKDCQEKHFYHEHESDDYLTQHLQTARTCVSTSIEVKNKVVGLSQKHQNTEHSGYNQSKHIPCLFYNGKISPEQLIIFFHSNAEDLVNAYEFTRMINSYSGQSVLVVQYPGYSFYQNNNPDQKSEKMGGEDLASHKAEIIENDALRVIEYVMKVGYLLKNITAMGRSIGSGPAVFLASVYRLRALVLISPFLSLGETVKDLYGNLFASLLKERFNNKERIQYVECPILLIHGKEDKMISFNHSIKLQQKIKSYSCLKIVQSMTHSRFRCYQDLIKYLNNFYKAIDST